MNAPEMLVFKFQSANPFVRPSRPKPGSVFIPAVAQLWFIPATGNRNWSNGTLNNVGSNGNYWSATPSSTTNGRNLNFNATGVNPNNNNNRANGFAARCLSEF